MKKKTLQQLYYNHNIVLIIGLFMINKRILNTDEKSDSLKQKINQIESQLDVLIDDTKNAKQQVVVANKDFIQLSNYGCK